MSVQKTSKNTPVKKEVKRREKKKLKVSNENFVPVTARKSVEPIDVTNDAEMIKEGLRKPLVNLDPEWSKKTPEERKILSRVRKIKGLRPSHWVIKEDPLKRRVTVHLKNPEKLPNFKSTYSTMIEPHKLVGYLELYFFKIRGQIQNIYYDGKKYKWSIIHKKQ